MKTTAAVVDAPGGAHRISEIDLTGPRAGEVLVRIVASGVCHTDQIAQEQVIPVPLPAVLGHEGAGVVVEVGAGVDDLRPGDGVCLSFASCGQCLECLKARPFLCRDFNRLNFSGRMRDGSTRLSRDGAPVSVFFGQSSFAGHAVVDRRSLVKLPAGTDLRQVAPLGCGIQTGAGAVLNRLRPEFGSSIAIIGCGTVGLSAVMAAALAGCERVVAIGGKPQSLELALELGATHVVNRHEHGDIADAVKDVGGGLVDYAIDTSGVPMLVRAALASCRPGGAAVVLGVTGELAINVQQELMGESKSLIGVVEGDSVPAVFLPQLIEYQQLGRFPFERLITYYPFDEINRAVADSAAGRTIKAVLTTE
jgi:aryl-alcohol dehydrogenase